MRSGIVVRRLLGIGSIAAVVMLAAGLGWLRWDANQPRDALFDARQGTLESATALHSTTRSGQVAESILLESGSGLAVTVRVVRGTVTDQRLPVLVVLGGHRTGGDAVELFGDVGARAVIGIDYPYEGPEKVRGARQTLGAMPKVRQAILDTVPSVSLVIDWVFDQTWADTSRIVLVGASLGVPFAVSAAARDDRIAGVMLVHGAADNRLWLEAQLARRVDVGPLDYPLSVVLHWAAYGPIFDTGFHVGEIAPRPVVIVGAREDERTPAGQTELLFEMTGQPKRLRWTDGGHVEPDRPDIIADLLRIADEELPFLTGRGAETTKPP